MLRFRVFRDGKVPDDFDLSTAYLVGVDGVPVRGEFTYVNGEIQCRKRAGGPAALNCLWETKTFGSIMLETTRLPEREEPYLLNLELARGRMMRVLQKREDWGLFDIAEAQAVNEKAGGCRDLIVEAMMHMDEPLVAADFSDKCLAAALPMSEQTALTHADLLLLRRISTKNFPRSAFGTRVDPAVPTEAYRRIFTPNSDFVMLPMKWRTLEPQEQAFDWVGTDEWVDFLHRRAKMPIVAGPLVYFHESCIPDWLYIWEHDYETVRDLLYEHINRVVGRYSQQVLLWNVLSGLHVNAQFSFTFDQLMDLTRMAVGLVKKINPNARTMIEITQPWGEYYANNQRSIPPLLYAEMVVQGGISFDVFGLQLRFGVPRDGCWQRDLFQISSMLDRFAPLGKPLMLSGLQVPSQPADAAGGAAGVWRKPWTEQLQSKWLEAVTDIALSKPFVEAICWHELSDTASRTMPFGGLIGADLTPKIGFKTWSSLRRALINYKGGKPAPAAGANPLKVPPLG
jgi:hypothetical protein